MSKSRNDTRIYSRNKFKLGLFGMNCSGGLSLTKAPERWEASWINNVCAAQLADAAGLEFLLPIARWHGYKGEIDSLGTTFETLTWACGLLASTKEITTFGTLHVSFVNPVFAAKQMVTADHIGQGRFGLNIVSGWNPLEFGSMGVDLRDHDDRYAYTREWLSIVEKVWAEREAFDYDGTFFKLKDVLGKPKPWWNSRPLLVAAGNSEIGRDFAANRADCLFTAIPSLEEVAPKIAYFRKVSPSDQVRNIFASSHLMVRRTRKEAEDYHHYIVHEHGDWESASYAANLKGSRPNSWMKQQNNLEARLITGAGFPIIGSYDDAIETFQKLHALGLNGLALGMINYIEDFPHIRDEILPRMERVGLRHPHVDAISLSVR